jgi:hypothetical protein
MERTISAPYPRLSFARARQFVKTKAIGLFVVPPARQAARIALGTSQFAAASWPTAWLRGARPLNGIVRNNGQGSQTGLLISGAAGFMGM